MWGWLMRYYGHSDHDRAYYAICKIVEDVHKKQPHARHPAIPLKNIARRAGMTKTRTFAALCDLEIGVPTKGHTIGREPCVHSSGDNWYLGGHKQGRWGG